MTTFCTPAAPYTPDSMWRRRPLGAVFDTYAIPKTAEGWNPIVSTGDFSVEIVVAKGTEAAKVVSVGRMCDTWLTSQKVTIPHCPTFTIPGGSDKYVSVIDAATGLVYEMWGTAVDGSGNVSCGGLGIHRIDGTGWPTPKYVVSNRSSQAAAMGGVIRTAEAVDGEARYSHVLACTLDHTALGTGYVFPACGADDQSTIKNTGNIPMGALLGLPPGFSTAGLTADETKLALSLILDGLGYGMRVVDRNTGTPFQILCQRGIVFTGGGFTSAGLNRILSALRVATSVSQFAIDEATPGYDTTNLFSMRNQYGQDSLTVQKTTGVGTAAYDPVAGMAVITAGTNVTCRGPANWGFTTVPGLQPFPGDRIRVTAVCKNGAKVQYQQTDNNGSTARKPLDDGTIQYIGSNFLSDGQQYEFIWRNMDGIGHTPWIQGDVGASGMLIVQNLSRVQS